MATHNTIYSCENDLMNARTACKTAHAAAMVEVKLDGEKLYDENQVVWQSLYDNARLLQQTLDALTTFLSPHVKVK